MNISEFLSTYNLHDSLISLIKLADTKLIMTVDFCYWMQNGYDESEPETGIIKLTFEGVSNYTGITGELDDFSILDVMYNNGVVTFTVCDDYNDISYQLQFSSNSLSVDK